MVEAHGGKIYASSIMEKGSTFTIELPINNKEEEANETNINY